MAAKRPRKSCCKKAAAPAPRPAHPDQDLRKGAFEAEAPGAKSQSSLRGQLSHRTRDELLKDSYSDRSG